MTFLRVNVDTSQLDLCERTKVENIELIKIVK